MRRTSYSEDLLRARQLKRLFDVRLLATDNLYLALAAGTTANTPAALFRDWVVEACS